jgi:hypothetical protein
VQEFQKRVADPTSQVRSHEVKKRRTSFLCCLFMKNREGVLCVGVVVFEDIERGVRLRFRAFLLCSPRDHI